MKVEAFKLRSLDSEKALEIMVKEKPVAERLKHGILRTKFELYPDCRAILHIYTNRQAKKKQKLEEEKETCASQV